MDAEHSDIERLRRVVELPADPQIRRRPLRSHHGTGRSRGAEPAGPLDPLGVIELGQRPTLRCGLRRVAPQLSLRLRAWKDLGPYHLHGERALGLIGCGLGIDLPQPRHIVLGSAVIEVHAVLLLLDVRELGVAEGETVAVPEQNVGQCRVPREELLDVLGRRAVPPGSLGGAAGDGRTAILADEVGLAPIVGSLVEDVVLVRVIAGQREGAELVGEAGRILVVVVAVEHIGPGIEMHIAACIQEGPRRVDLLSHRKHRLQQCLPLPRARLVERAPADDGGMVAVAPKGLAPLQHGLGAHGGVALIQAPVRVLGPDQVA